MTNTLDATGELGRRLSVRLPAEDLEAAYRHKLQDRAKAARLKGFRAGHVPWRILEQRYGHETWHEVVDEAVATSYRQALEEHGLRPAGRPRLEQDLHGHVGQDLAFSIAFEVLPQLGEFRVPDNDRPRSIRVTVTDEDIDKAVAQLRDRLRTWQKVAREARDGDRVTFRAHPEHHAEQESADQAAQQGPYHLVLDDKAADQHLVAVLRGAQGGETRTFQQQSAPQAPAEQNSTQGEAGEAGPDAVNHDGADTTPVQETQTWLITVEEVSEPVWPDEQTMIERLGMADMAALREKLASSLRHEAQDKATQASRRQWLDRMAQAHVPILPETLVAEEQEAMRRMVASSMGIPHEKATEVLDASMFASEARAQVARMILVGELARLWQLELDKERLIARLQEVAQAQKEPYQKVLEAYRDHAGFRSGISLAVLEEQVFDAIKERYGTEEVDMELQQAMEVAA